jgi:hypothetical protein
VPKLEEGEKQVSLSPYDSVIIAKIVVE